MSRNFYQKLFAVLLLSTAGTVANAQYCAPTGSLDCITFNDAITNITFAGINNSTGCGAGSYTSYTSGTPATTIQGNTYTFTVSVGDGSDKVAIWIDYNHNNTFDAAEFTNISGSSTGTLITSSVTIPATALTGPTTMRVRERYSTVFVSSEACSAPGTWGETEDYTVIINANVTTPPGCVAAPLAPANGSTTVCSGTTVLRWNKVNTATGYDVYFNSGASPATTIVATNQPDTFYNATTLVGPYVWRIVPRNASGLATGCSNFTFTTVAGITPTASITVSPNDTICFGTKAIFTATTTNGGAAPAYQWKKNNVNVGTNSSTYADSLLMNNDVIKVTITSNATGCLSTATATSNSITMVIIPAPLTTITEVGNTQFCQGGSVTLQATQGGITYQWRVNGANIAGATTSSYTATASGNYSVVVTNSTACAAISDPTVVTVYPTPGVYVNRFGDVLTTASYFTTYQWYRNNVAITSMGNSNSYVFSHDGNYVVMVTDTNGCSGSSAYVPVNSLSVGTTPAASDISIYPNPASDMVYINSPVMVNITIRSMDGKVVLHQEATGKVDISLLSNGVYFVQLADKNNYVLKTEKLIKRNN